MKVLVIGVYRDGTGYGHYCTHLINSLLAADPEIDVVTRFVRLTYRSPEINQIVAGQVPEMFQELEKKDLQNVDIVIQNILPSFFLHNSKAIFVGSAMYETDKFFAMEWVKRSNEMDHIFVPSQQSFDCFVNSGVNKDKLQLQPLGFDIEKIQAHTEKVDLSEQIDDDTKVFYFIGDIGPRKFLTGLLRAYYYEFRPWEKVCLFIKGYMSGEAKTDTERLASYVNEIKNNMKLNEYPPIIIKAGYDTEEEILSIHERGDFFVSASRGESLGLDAITALAKGNPIVVANAGGAKLYADNEVGRVVQTNQTPVIGLSEQAPPELYIGYELWDEPQILDLSHKMREIFELDDTSLNKMKTKCKIRVQDWTYKNAGNKFRGMFDQWLS